MPSSDITTCVSLHCPKRWRCAVHYSNCKWDRLVESMCSNFDPFKPPAGYCEYFVEIKESSK